MPSHVPVYVPYPAICDGSTCKGDIEVYPAISLIWQSKCKYRKWRAPPRGIAGSDWRGRAKIGCCRPEPAKADMEISAFRPLGLILYGSSKKSHIWDIEDIQVTGVPLLSI